MVWCNFYDKTAIDYTVNLKNVNLKEISSDEIMRYHFLDREVEFNFYNLYGYVNEFFGRKCRVVNNKDDEIVQQTFVCHRDFVSDSKNINSLS